MPTTANSIAINGFALREIRKLAGVNTSDFARQIGCDPSYIRRLEGGHNKNVSPKTFKAIVEALCIADRRALLVAPHAEAVA